MKLLVRRMMKVGAVYILCLILLLSSVVAAASEDAPESSNAITQAVSVEEGKNSDPEEKIDYLDNGTLYNTTFHHRRPARSVGETWDSMKKKTFKENLSFRMESDFYSRYTTLGLAASRGWVWQPSAVIELYGLGFSVWGNFVLDNIPDQGKFNEVDFVLYYDMKLGNLTIHPFVTFLYYPTDNQQSLDYSPYNCVVPSLHLAYSLGPIDLYTEFAAYANHYKGSVYLGLGLGIQKKIVDKLGIETFAQINFANSRFNKAMIGVPESQFTYFEYSLGFPWNPIKGLVVEPSANIISYFSQNFRDAVPYPTLVWGGVSIAYNF